jgi:hypothetical protein
MKKSLFTFITVLSLLILTTGTVFAAPLADGYLLLREVRNDAGGGVIFIFDVVGEFSKSDFKGSFLTFGDSKVPLDCKVESSTLYCTTSRVTAGQYVTLNIGGFIFWARVPDRSGEGSTSSDGYCYPVLDLVEEGEGEAWEQFDTHCQDTPANYGDTLIYFSEVFFELMPSSPFCTPSQSGDAFYRDVFCLD